MAAEVGFVVHDERGSGVLDELQRRTGVPPYLASPTERHYNLTDSPVDASGIDAMLEGNRLRDLHVQLDRAVVQAYGFTPQDDLLAQLLALNESIADEAETGTTMPRGPGDTGFANTQRTTSLLESSLELSSA